MLSPESPLTWRREVSREGPACSRHRLSPSGVRLGQRGPDSGVSSCSPPRLHLLSRHSRSEEEQAGDLQQPTARSPRWPPPSLGPFPFAVPPPCLRKQRHADSTGLIRSRHSLRDRSRGQVGVQRVTAGEGAASTLRVSVCDSDMESSRVEKEPDMAISRRPWLQRGTRRRTEGPPYTPAGT